MPRATPSVGARLALWAIRRYQRHLSPYKGFSCALRVTTGGAGCSAYGYRAIARHGLTLGLQLLDRRLARCGQAHRAHRAPRANQVRQPAVNPVLGYQRGDCVPCDCDLPSPGDCFSNASNALDCCSCELWDGCDRDRWRRWRERRWLKKAARRQREQAERDARARIERELRDRQDRNSRF